MRVYKVLLVDDEERIRKGMKKLLEEVIGGFRVVAEAGNGREGLEQLRQCHPDVIFSDIRMPEMDGIEMIRRLRQTLPDIPVLILSGYDEYDYMRQAMKSHVTDYILKPVDRVELAETMQRLRKMLDARTPAEPEDATEARDTDKRQVIRNIKELVNENLQKDISLQQLATQVNYSYAYLSVLFKSETGQSFSEYLTGRRMEKACRLLKETQLRIFEVGNLCGYQNAKYFMSIFKEVTGMTPSDYRDQSK